MRCLVAIILLIPVLSSCESMPTTPNNNAEISQAETNDKIFDLPYLMRDLDNGLRVIVVKTDYPDVVTIQIPVQTGSRNEVEPGKSGFAHFFEHMMFRGTEKYSAEVYGEILQNAGADQNAYTTDDYTNYHITFTKADLEKVIELEADRFQNLKYTEDQFRTEALAVKGEYLKNYSNPIQKLLERIRVLAFKKHTYRHTTMGFLEDIEDMPNQLEYSKVFFDRWYRPEKTAVMLVGDVDPENTFELVKKYWGSWEAGNYNVDIPQEPPPSGPLYEHLVWEAPTQPWLVMAFRGPAYDPRAKDMPTLDVISEIYFSESTDVYQEVVNKNRWADQFFTYFPDRTDANLLMIGARLTDAKNAPNVRDAIMDTLATARTQLVDEQQVEETKSRLKYGFAAQMDNSEAIGENLASFVQFERTPETINDVYRSYAGVTTEDVRTYANKYFVDQSRIVMSLSNESSLPGMDAIPSLANLVALKSTSQTTSIPATAMANSSPLVDVSYLFNTGPAYDPPGKKGLAALTASMVTEGGSEKRSIQEINQALYPIAAGFGAQVDKEMVRLSGSVHKDNLDTWYKLASEQLYTPGWRQEDFDRVKTQHINAIRTNLVGNNDEELGKEALYSFIYGANHPYGSLNLGATDDLESLTLEDVQAFYQQHFTPANLTLGLAGGFDSNFAGKVKSDASKLATGTVNAIQLPSPPAIDGRHALIIHKETPAVGVSFGFPITVRRGDPDWVALWLARSWLGEHRSSNAHLYKRIREERGMNYGDYAYIEYFPRGMFQFHPDANLGRQQQIFQVWIRPLRNNSDAHFATRVAMRELQTLIDKGLSETEFQTVKSFLEKFVSLLVKTQSRQLGYQLDSEYYGTDSFADYVRADLAKLTAKDVNRVIRKHLQTENVKYVFISKDAVDLRKRLQTDQYSPIEYNTPKPELEKEDQEIANLKLALDSIEIVPADEMFK